MLDALYVRIERAVWSQRAAELVWMTLPAGVLWTTSTNFRRAMSAAGTWAMALSSARKTSVGVSCASAAFSATMSMLKVSGLTEYKAPAHNTRMPYNISASRRRMHRPPQQNVTTIACTAQKRLRTIRYNGGTWFQNMSEVIACSAFCLCEGQSWRDDTSGHSSCPCLDIMLLSKVILELGLHIIHVHKLELG